MRPQRLRLLAALWLARAAAWGSQSRSGLGVLGAHRWRILMKYALIVFLAGGNPLTVGTFNNNGDCQRAAKSAVYVQPPNVGRIPYAFLCVQNQKEPASN